MKNLKTYITLSLLFLGVIQLTNAQNSWLIKYDIEVTGELDAMTQSMMEGASLTLAFEDDKVHFNMDQGMVKMSASVEGKTRGLMLMDMMGMKIAVPMTEEDLAEENNNPESKITKLEGTKEIAGYKCNHARIENEDQTMEVWYTDKIKPKNMNTQMTAQYDALNGFPLEMIMREGQMPMTMTATEVSKKVPKDLFNFTIPDGYTEMSMEELQNMGGGN